MTSEYGIMMKKQLLAIPQSQPLGTSFSYMSFMILLLSIFLMSIVKVSAADLQTVDYSSLPGEKTQIVLTFSEPVELPKSFSIDEPARIVLDFSGVHNQLDKKTQQINIGVTNSVSTVEAGNRTRVVINLVQKAPYTVEQDGNIVLVTVGSVAIAKNTGGVSREVTDIDFRRGEKGEARLTIQLSDSGVIVDVRQEGDNIIVDLVGTSLPESLHRRLDVIDFATPIQIIDSEQNGNDTRLTLSTEGKFEHLTYQSENTLVVELKPIVENLQSTAKKDQFGYKGEKLSLNFQNIEVRAVLQLLADFTGLNLVTSDTVTGNVTLRLKNVPWDQALDIILKTKGLAERRSGNVMLIAPAVEIAAREKQELEAQKQLIQLEPLFSEVIEINFAKAADLAEILDPDDDEQNSEGETGFLSERGSVAVDERTNSLLLRDTATQLAQIHELLEKLDIPVRQVLIESRIVIANNDFTKELGVRFGTTAKSNTLGAGIGGSLDDLVIDASGDKVGTVTPSSLNVNLPVANSAGTFALALAKLPFGAILELELSAMQEEGKGEVISSPRVVTSNQKKATIKQGREIPYQEASSSGATTVSFKEAVLSLDVTPQITPDDRIVMDLEIHKDEVGEVFLGIPSIDTRSITTQVLVDNGETVVLGGIYEQNKGSASRRVPFFGDLPYVGFLFKTTTNQDIQRELLVFITPKIIKDSLTF